MAYRAQRSVRRQGTEIHADSRTQRLRTRSDSERAAVMESLEDIELAEQEYLTKELPWVQP